MNHPKTHVAIVIDKSGSMESIRNKVVTSFNEQVQQMKINEKEGHDIRCSLVSFNGRVTENFWNVKASEVKELRAEDYNPDGGTAMLDGLGYTLTKLKKLAAEDAETAFLIIILSDGDTNSDVKFTANPDDTSRIQIRPLVEACEEEKRWTITYIGCDKSYLNKVAAMTGVRLGNMAVASYDNDELYEQSVGAGMLRSTAGYFTSRARGETAVMSFCSSTGTGNSPADWTTGTIGSPSITVTSEGGSAPYEVTWQGVGVPPKKGKSKP